MLVLLMPLQDVAPRAGAWIETLILGNGCSGSSVAPRAGAWIETIDGNISATSALVAPRAGAWIETKTFTYS